jgi:cellulose biosynthesis protein BcsQ
VLDAVWRFFAQVGHLLWTQPAAALAFVISLGLLRPLYLGWRAAHQIGEARRAVGRRTVRGASVEGAGFWLKDPAPRPPGYDTGMAGTIPVLMVGSLKGGVGKTTLSVNLAAHFASRWKNKAGEHLRVLAVDLDFQGSLSTMTVAVDGRFAQPSKANELVSGELWGGRVVQAAIPLVQPDGREASNLSVLPATYDLATAENRVVLEWLFPQSDRELLDPILRLFGTKVPKTKSDADLRYKMAEAFLDPAVQKAYDLIVLDAPPRLTTAHIQALCASTHLLIPTILDQLSGDAIARYADQVAVHKMIAPHLKIIGVVGSVVPPNVPVKQRIGDLEARLSEARLVPPILPEENFIHQRSLYRDTAGEQVAYFNESNSQGFRDLRQEVDVLGRTVAEAMNWRERGWTTNEARVEGWLEG